ncbi:MAG: hypothetical protein HFJ50_03585 [Clostridia bacterium]|jgi:3D (Asp-Asp-Asp) domain-containing protein|nr:hypothetical protein [Clostridia bacterium]
MIKSEQASLSVMRIAVITIIAIFMLSVCVLAASSEVKNVKIVLSDNCEIDVLTTKTVVADILEESHIVVLPEENVVPNLTSEITDTSSKIVITGRTQDAYSAVAIAEEEGSVYLDQLLSAYNTIIEKIVVIEENIPYQTITKDVSTSNEGTVTTTLQDGKEGLKKATYKVKYQNDIEIGRTLINEEVIGEPTDKIVQIANVTNRGSKNETRKPQEKKETNGASGGTLASKVEGIEPIVKTLNASAYTASEGHEKTASGALAKAWYTVAAGKGYPMGTIIYIPHFANQPNGGWFVVQDRGGAITNNKIDIYMNTYNECITFGRRNIECYIYLVK